MFTKKIFHFFEPFGAPLTLFFVVLYLRLVHLQITNKVPRTYLVYVAIRAKIKECLLLLLATQEKGELLTPANTGMGYDR